MTNEVEYSKALKRSVKSNPKNAYLYSTPIKMDKDKQYPLVIALDAQANGEKAIKRLMKASDFRMSILVASLYIKNGRKDFSAALEELKTELEKEYPIDPSEIYLVGFSGGARMGLQYSLNHPISGVFMIGAGPADMNPAVPVYVLTGFSDFNFSENYRRPSPNDLDSEILYQFFEGKHEWPESGELKKGLIYLMKDRLTFSSDYLSSLEIESDKSWVNEEMISALKLQELLARLSSTDDSYRTKYQKTLTNENYKDQIATLEAYLLLENDLRTKYFRKSEMADSLYWQNEIQSIEDKINASENYLEADHHRRTKAFLGIFFYSQLSANLSQPQLPPNTSVILYAFELLEPNNPDVFYLKARYAWHFDDELQAVENLNKAKGYGFKDKELLYQTFPHQIVDNL